MKYRFEDSPGKLTQELSKTYGRALLSAIRMEGYDLSIAEWSTLSILSSRKQASQNEIARFLDEGKVFVKRLLDKMEDKKLVRRSISKSDRRYNIVQMTPSGKALFEKIRPLAEKTITRASQGISDEDYHQFLRVIEKMQENLER